MSTGTRKRSPRPAKSNGAARPAELRAVDPVDAAEVCVCVPTYNEAENLERFVAALLEQFTSLGVDGVVLVIDDNSPDGTGAIADRLAEADPRVHVIHRAEKDGIGPAYIAGFDWALRHEIGTVAQMDCDFSHDPADLGRLLEASGEADLVLGSRYVAGGRVVDWPWWRRAISRGGSWYARLVLGAKQRDLTSGFKCFGPGALRRIPFADVSATGYGFQVEVTWRALLAGLEVKEVPVTFRDRTRGSSKMSPGIAGEAALMVPRLRYRQGRPAEERTGPGARAWLAIIATVVATVVLVASFPAIGYALLAAEFVLAALIGLSTLGFMLYGWRDPDGLAETAFPPPVGVEPRHSFSLIVPARHEEAVLAATLRKLAQQEYGEVEVIVVVGHDDPGTERVAREAVVDDPRFKVVVDDSSAKNKPRALNAALPHCTGDVVGVFDAEDIVAPGLLRATDEVFQRSGADVVQGAVALMNLHTSWFSVRNVLEYYFWFKSRLHFHAKHGYIPLGGNTVFVKRDWLTSHGGWDGDCLAEDCELGTRLSVLGARTVVAYSSDLVTREETPATLPELLRQRTRWNQGFLQVLRKRQWTRLPLRSRGLALYTLGFPVLQALLGLSVPLAIAMALFVQLPILLALLSFVPLAALGAILVAELVGLAHFCREFSLRARPLDYLRLVIGSIPYQVLLSAAALRAGWREMYRVNDWEKTAHVGAHL